MRRFILLLIQLMPLYLRRLSFFLGVWLLGGVLLRSQAQCLPAPACRPGSAPASAGAYGMGILRVQLADLDTTTVDGREGYQDYSCRGAISLNRGTTYTLRVSTGPATDENLRAWLDRRSTLRG